MNRLKGIIIAGTLTGLVLITILAFSIRNANAANEQTALPDVSFQAQPANSLSGQEAVQAWQNYSSELENTIRIMQARETEYQTQLDAANQTILQLQDQLNNQPTIRLGGNQEHEWGEHDD